MDGAPAEPPEDEPGELVDPRAIDLVLRVGDLLLASGESTERINESMLSLALAYELPRCEVQVTFTALMISVHPGQGATPVTAARTVRRRTPAYWRLTELHSLVQEASIGMLELDEAHKLLAEIKHGKAPYPPWLLVVCLGLIAASAAVLGGGGPLVAATAFVATLFGDRTAAALARRGVAEFFQLSVAAAIAAAAAILVIGLGASDQAATIVTGSVLALLPGRPLVASIQDGVTGNMVNAGARLLEVFFLITAIVAGLGLVVSTAPHVGVTIDVEHLPDSPASLSPVAILAAAAVSLTFAVCLVVPRKVLVPAAIGGAVIWVLYVLLLNAGVMPVLAAAISAVVIGTLGSYYAARRRVPALPYIVPAISPLLPGTLLYKGMVELNSSDDPTTGLLSLVAALSVGLALGAGVNLGGELVRAFQRVGLSASGRWARPAARRTRGF